MKTVARCSEISVLKWSPLVALLDYSAHHQLLSNINCAVDVAQPVEATNS